jgi:hypothetical protein
MHLRPHDAGLLPTLRQALVDRFALSRFVVRECYLRRREVVVKGVRLRHKRDYCGQHPGPCVATPFPRPHRRSSCLQGADWVGFNRLINDLCDEGGWAVDAWSTSTEFSGKMRIRLGTRRRTRYGSEYAGPFGRQVWQAFGDEEEDFADRCGGKAPPEVYPEGTPGEPTWELPRTRETIMRFVEEGGPFLTLAATKIDRRLAVELLRTRLRDADRRDLEPMVDDLFGGRRRMSTAQILEEVFSRFYSVPFSPG